MGGTLSKEEEAVLKLLNHILSKRGIIYDGSTLRLLLVWAKEKGHFTNFNDAFETVRWEAVGKDLWDAVSKGDKEAMKLSTTWHLVSEALCELKAEREVTQSAFVALGPQSSMMPSEPPPLGLFLGRPLMAPPMIPRAPVPSAASPLPPWTTPTSPAPALTKEQKSGKKPKPDRQNYVEQGACPKKEVRYGLPDSRETEDWSATPPPPEFSPDTDNQKRNIPSSYPPLPDSSDEDMPAEARGNIRPTRLPTDSVCLVSDVENGRGDADLQALEQRLEALHMDLQKRKQVTTFGPQPTKGVVPLESLPNSPQGGGMMGGGDTGGSRHLRGEEQGGVQWKGIIRDALLEGVIIPQAYPVITGANGLVQHQPLDWKLVKEARQAIQSNGLHSQFAQAIFKHVFVTNVLTPSDSPQLASMLLSPSQLIHFQNAWTANCNRIAHQPRQQGDSLYGITAQQLLGESPFGDPA